MIEHIAPVHVVTFKGAIVQTYHANKGQGLPRHAHEFAHLTLCHAGRLIVRKDGRELTMTKDTQPVYLTAGQWHEIEALEDGTVFANVL